ASADYLLQTVDQEKSAAHTVSYTCALALLAALAAAIGDNDDLVQELQAIPDQLALLLGQESWAELAARFADRRRYWFVGGGPNAATAYEAALKMSEANHATALGLGCEQFLHGPWAALEPGDVVFLIAPPGRPDGGRRVRACGDAGGPGRPRSRAAAARAARAAGRREAAVRDGVGRARRARARGGLGRRTARRAPRVARDAPRRSGGAPRRAA